MAGERALPADVLVEPLELGEARYIFLSIEGTSFELRPADALAIGVALAEEARRLTAREEDDGP